MFVTETKASLCNNKCCCPEVTPYLKIIFSTMFKVSVTLTVLTSSVSASLFDVIVHKKIHSFALDKSSSIKSAEAGTWITQTESGRQVLVLTLHQAVT